MSWLCVTKSICVAVHVVAQFNIYVLNALSGIQRKRAIRQFVMEHVEKENLEGKQQIKIEVL
ncbi:hypothetical protein CBW53_02845 [Yersinia frederiksenii]|nr:hypothetical protein CBW53_02845 [Yersinia frederiksenii]